MSRCRLVYDYENYDPLDVAVQEAQRQLEARAERGSRPEPQDEDGGRSASEESEAERVEERARVDQLARPAEVRDRRRWKRPARRHAQSRNPRRTA